MFEAGIAYDKYEYDAEYEYEYEAEYDMYKIYFILFITNYT